MKKLLFIAVIFMAGFFGVLPSFFAQDQQAEQLTVSAYYPTPYGVYRRLQIYPTPPGQNACSSDNEGAVFFDNSIHRLNACRTIGNNSFWEDVSKSVINTTEAKKGHNQLSWDNKQVSLDIIEFTLLEDATFIANGYLSVSLAGDCSSAGGCWPHSASEGWIGVRILLDDADADGTLDLCTSNQSWRFAACPCDWLPVSTSCVRRLSKGVHQVRLIGEYGDSSAPYKFAQERDQLKLDYTLIK